MESDSWSRFSSNSRRHQSTHQSRFDMYLGFEDMEGEEDESRAEFVCPFCIEEFDMVSLCCHINEEHPVEAKNGVCPVCTARVGMDLVGHITMQHGNFFKISFYPRLMRPIYFTRVRRGSSGSHSTLSFLRKELRDGNLQSLLGGPSYMVAPPNAAPDPLLSSFITNLPVPDMSKDVQPEISDEGDVVNMPSHEKEIERIEPALSEKDQEERSRRCEFAQGLLLSTIFDDIL
ncbi:protein DEHYDRATION-INDUCED 19-like protein 2-like [Iris pallida]|uniref:Protein DEHYDRATION-INDUCED 19-like protein 2-like n=1 Tax=Iris pallida TaxID=29817 RepID=A0AAX6IHY6_IRIPA|nr:protein DEHYDRATION-INDUCED 19-like protein 2-like [Iris pallida]